MTSSAAQRRLSTDETALFDAMPQLGWVADPDGRITHYNRRWYEYTGTGPEPENAMGWGWQHVHDPAILPAVVERWCESLESGEPFEMSFPLRRHDGGFRWFMCHAAPERDPNGRIARWLGVCTDVDSLKRAEFALEDAVKVREDVLAIVSHDLRNPLSVVLLAAKQIELMADDTVRGTRTKKAASRAVNAVSQMGRLVGDLLDQAKLEANQSLPMELQEHNVVALAERAVASVESLVSARNLRLQTALEGPAYALCDDDRISQLLANLIGNAIKFTPEGGIIRVAVRGTAGRIDLSVSDTGAGIPKDQLPHIFEPYWQADVQRNRGAGLGLSIVKAIVLAHGGRIWVESSLDVGSTFFVTLPAAEAPPSAAAPTEDKDNR